jgi:hypothetical protein
MLNSNEMARPQNVEGSAESLCAAAGCAQPDQFVQAALLLWVVALVLVALFGAVRVPRARTVAARERERTGDERDAFERFRRRIAGWKPAPRPATSTPRGDGGGLATQGLASDVVGPPPDDDRLDAVREAYRETVMSVPHYETEYDEPLQQHIGAEFTPEVARAVTRGDRLTPQLRNALVAGAQEHVVKRDDLVEAIDDELASLTDAETRLERVEREVESVDERQLLATSYEELATTWKRLDAAEDDLAALAEDRQETLRQELSTRHGSRDRHAFHGYLYGDCDGRYPVLADVGRLLDDLRRVRSDVLDSLSRRV